MTKNPYKAAAKAAGEKIFYDNVPCPYGHNDGKRVHNSACVTCSRDECRIRARNRPKTEDSRRKRREYARQRYSENKDRINAQLREYYAKNKKRFSEVARAWRLANPDKFRAIQQRWQEKNPTNILARAARRRAQVRQVGGTFSAADIARIGRRQWWKCVYCGDDISMKFHVDHIIPVARGGTNYCGNIQILCASCNRSKGKKLPIEWRLQYSKSYGEVGRVTITPEMCK